MMNAYLVRLIATKELVGIFVCGFSDLFWSVDECADPTSSEYVAIGRGAIMWPSVAPCVPVSKDDVSPLSFTDAHLNETWASRVYQREGAQLQWKRVPPPSDEGGRATA